MWSEDINRKILEGENSNHPPNNDKAWDNMEALLDKHLPVTKKRRRIIFFLLPLLLGAGTAIFLISQKTNREQTPITKEAGLPTAPGPQSGREDQTVPPASPAEKVVSPASPDIPVKGTSEAVSQPVNETAAARDQENNKTRQAPPVAGKRMLTTPNTPAPDAEQSLTDKSGQRPAQAAGIGKKKNKPGNTVAPKTTVPAAPDLQDQLAAVEKKDKKETPAPVATSPLPDSTAVDKKITADKKVKEDSVQTATVKTSTKSQKAKSSFADRFGVSFSFGPDISGVSVDNPGTVQLQYGLGLSYALSKRFTVRTGFYAGDKKYDADSGDYHPPYTINNLEKIEADCYIYEIPLTLVYNFKPVKKHNWFVAGGFSSYLMQKETYEYYYKNTWGQPQHYSRTYKNGNLHLFSALNLSGGYQYNLSGRLSLSAEPYVKVPLNGIGVGQVKLGNTGVLFTVGFKPFYKK